MATSKLSRLLDIFEGSSGALSIRELAGELNISPGRVESMLEYWIRKGKVRVSHPVSQCFGCGVLGDCPMILDLPRIYELVQQGERNQIEPFLPICG